MPPPQNELAQVETSSSHWRSDSCRTAVLLVSLVALLIVIPMVFLGNVSGHDFEAHVASWMEIAGQWREGILFPRWAEWSNSGFGEPRFILYPPATWVMGAALGSLLPWRIVPGVLIFLTLVVAGVAMWKLARQWLSGLEAAAAAVFFVANPYHLVMIYYRSDFAELLASALFPIIICGTLSVAREGWRRVPVLAIVFAGIWLSNAPTAVIATYSVVLLLGVSCLVRRSLRPLIPGSVALATGFGLAAFYILPAAWEQRWVQIDQAFADKRVAERNFLFTRAIHPYIFNWKVSAIAVGIMVFTACGIVFSREQRRNSRELWWMLVALAFASTFLMLPPSALLWKYLPELHYLQFPWRWLTPLNLVFAFFVAAANPAKRKITWLFAVVTVVGATGAIIARDAPWESQDVTVVAEEISSGQGYHGIKGFQPLGSTTDNLHDDSPSISELESSEDRESDASQQSQVVIQQWTAEQRNFLAQTTRPVTLALRLLNYPAWEVLMDGHATTVGSDLNTGQLLIPLDRGRHRVQVRFRRTWDRTAGDVIGAASAIGLIIAMFYSHFDASRRRLLAEVELESAS